MFTQFEKRLVFVNGLHIHCQIGGQGPGLLLLHGHPQTHMIWHKIADTLAIHFTVVAADLRGYGDSDKPPASIQHESHSKRVMAHDQIGLMHALGFEKFHIMAHDRGARVAHRLALDFPDAVDRMLLLDIAPTLAMYANTTEAFARAYWHWFFLIRPAPLPETLIEADPKGYLLGVLGARSAGMKPFSTYAIEEYVRCLSLPNAATGICEDYRASASIDLIHDQQDIDAGKRVRCPLRILWGKHGTVEKCFDTLGEWSKIASNVSGEALPCGHYIAEEVPSLLTEQAIAFFNSLT